MVYQTGQTLVGGLEHCFYDFHFIYGNDDELIFFQRGWNHQPGLDRLDKVDRHRGFTWFHMFLDMFLHGFSVKLQEQGP